MKENNLLVKSSVFFIKTFWQKRFGEKYNKKNNIVCRFYPSCSEYTIRAIKKHGFFKGWYLGYKRIRRCNLNNTESTVDYP